MLKACLGTTLVCVFAGVMMLMANKYNERACEIRYGAGDNQTLRELLGQPWVTDTSEQVCSLSHELGPEVIQQTLSLMERVWLTVSSLVEGETGTMAHFALRDLAHQMLEKCGEPIVFGPCCELCVAYRLVA